MKSKVTHLASDYSILSVCGIYSLKKVYAVSEVKNLKSVPKTVTCKNCVKVLRKQIEVTK